MIAHGGFIQIDPDHMIAEPRQFLGDRAAKIAEPDNAERSLLGGHAKTFPKRRIATPEMSTATASKTTETEFGFLTKDKQDQLGLRILPALEARVVDRKTHNDG
ncbi:hypothetical protein AAD018_000280 [Aestuariibius insulae]|uniref:hypothetical protein n=1 Tax=Aestuariibius insulae TaxID=2058287 RepID=UPI00345E8428